MRSTRFGLLFSILLLSIPVWARQAQAPTTPPQDQTATSPPPGAAASQRYSNRKPPESTDNELIVAYWTTETGWKSELQLRNNLAGQDLVVTPVLRLAGDGAETALAPVTIKSQE